MIPSPRGRHKLPSILYAHGLRCLGISANEQSDSDSQQLLTPQNVADLLRISRISVMNLVLTGKLTPEFADQKTGKTLFSLDAIFAAAGAAIRSRPRIPLALLVRPAAEPALGFKKPASRKRAAKS